VSSIEGLLSRLVECANNIPDLSLDVPGLKTSVRERRLLLNLDRSGGKGRWLNLDAV